MVDDRAQEAEREKQRHWAFRVLPRRARQADLGETAFDAHA